MGSFSGGVNLEALAAIEPDLIIGSTARSAEVYDLLSEIAPTVVTTYSFYESAWRDNARLIADVAGYGDAIELELAALDERVEEVAARLADRAAAPLLSRVDLYLGTPLYYQFECVWFGEVLLSVGVDQPESQRAECEDGDPGSAVGYLSLETLDVLDADVIVAYQQQAAPDDVGADPIASLAASPVWSQLSAVQLDRVEVVGDAWGLGASIDAAEVILDDIETLLSAPG